MATQANELTPEEQAEYEAERAELERKVEEGHGNEHDDEAEGLSYSARRLFLEFRPWREYKLLKARREVTEPEPE